MYKNYVKRLLDILLGIMVLPLLILLTVILGVLIHIEDGGPVFYRAERRGIDGNIFGMIKFRTMKMNAPDIRNEDNSTFHSPLDTRLTKVGAVIRKISIDEIPQFLNVIKGDMSIIGPRPVTTDKPLCEYDEKRLVRLMVRPGITGYSQAYYRNSISQEEKFEHDAQYAMNVNFMCDFKIFLKTIVVILLRKNIYSNNSKGSHKS